MAAPDPLAAACAACRDRFPALLDGTLGDLDRLRAREHLASCAACRAALAAIEDAGRQPPGPGAPLDPGTREELLRLFRDWRAGRGEG